MIDSNSNKHSNCIICSSANVKSLKGYYEQHQLIKCQSCGLVFMERIPSKEELEKHYGRYSYGSERSISEATIKSYNKLLDEFEKYRSNNRILDVGCGRGWFLIEARKRGWEVYGTEYSETAVALCEKESIKMEEGALKKELFSNEYFDVITSFEVIEHINNPNEEINNIHSFLRRGGLFYCTTPNFNSIMRHFLKEKYDVIGYPEHLTYYSKRTLNTLLRKHGFKVFQFRSTGISITRLLNSRKTGKSEKLGSKESTDEHLRDSINRSLFLSNFKDLLNWLLTVSNWGLTLKGWYLKK
jgi:2-polyprenyl-3-methyl-5-hydroxy-6-metoxy-1,4-benzoquinol methylase